MAQTTTAAPSAPAGALTGSEKALRGVGKGGLRKAYREPSVRSLLDWTPASRRSAIALADSGNLRLAADLCETMMSDDRVVGCINTRMRGLMGLPRSFERGKDGRRSDLIVKALTDDEDFDTMCPESALVQMLAWGVMLGVGLVEHVWQYRGKRLIPVYRVWHPRWLRWESQERQWYLTSEEGEIEIAPGDGRWVFCMPYGADRPWSHGAWRAASLPWLAKSFSAQDWARYNEVHGAPVPVAISPEGSDDDDWRAFADDLAAEVTRAEEAYARARNRFVKSIYAYQRSMEPLRELQPKDLAKIILSQSYREGDLAIARAAIDEGPAALQSGSVDRVMASLRSRLDQRSTIEAP